MTSFWDRVAGCLRLRTLMFNGMRPIPRALFVDLGLDCQVEWRALARVFSYARVVLGE